MIEDTTIYLLTSAALGPAAVGLLLATRRLGRASRRYGYAAVLACGAMTVTYLLMSRGLWTVETTGNDESVVRFLGYTVAWAGISYVLGAVADAGPKRTAAVFVCSMGTLWATFGGWVFGGTAGTVISLTMVLSFVGLVYLLVGPLARTAATVSERRGLLYRKLEYLILLAWAGLLLLGLVSAQNLALTDNFVGQFAASYVDLVLFVGFGGLVVRNEAALEETAATTRLLPFSTDDGATDSGEESAGRTDTAS
ncbi:bacteriorhodopsin [Halobiforma nitratireducens]|uniref:Rhodopsin n=1 Tax=Halobiforma nitratireducens JCM 10879 TaxID=1227454 RepID=M0LQM6_9EURY|nr:bacteriorhodopsin [Halobiforma nitratireducens]EMA35398.1 rhodopsin [Halobiforma nitratireducens JCM 10879]